MTEFVRELVSVKGVGIVTEFVCMVVSLSLLKELAL